MLVNGFDATAFWGIPADIPWTIWQTMSGRIFFIVSFMGKEGSNRMSHEIQFWPKRDVKGYYKHIDWRTVEYHEAAKIAADLTDDSGLVPEPHKGLR